MATKSINIIQTGATGVTVTQISSNFSKSGNYWTGNAIFECASGYKWSGNVSTSVKYLPSDGWNLAIYRNGSTFNVTGNNSYISLQASSDPDMQKRTVRLVVLAGAGFTDDILNNWDWNFTTVLEVDGVQIPITATATNCTTNAPQMITTNTAALNVTATANSGYEFTSAPTATFYGANDTVIANLPFTIAANKLTAALNADLSQITLTDVVRIDITATAAQIAPTVTVPLIQNVYYCTTNAPQSVNSTDTALTITATPSNGYWFNDAPHVGFYDANGELCFDNNGNPAYYAFNVAASKLTASITLNVSTLIDLSTVDTVIIAATATEIPTPSVNFVTDLEFCTVNGIPQNVDINSQFTVTATANTGYKFVQAPSIYFLDANGNPNVINFTIAANELTATATVNLSVYELDGNETITLTATATAVTPYIDKYGTINVYKVTAANLSEFAQKRMFVEKISQPTDPAPFYEKIDLGAYVHSVKRLYCSVGETLQNVLKCGNYDTQINVLTPTNDTVNIDCGTVAIPTPNNDITDYQSEISIFLPFVGMQNVPVDLVGKTISLHYICNIVTADAVAILEYNNIKFAEYVCNVASEIIFMTNENYGAVRERGNIGNNSEVLRGLQPYIIVKYFDSENGKIYNNDAKRIALNQIVGFAQITEITDFVNAEITDSEKTMLINALANGVIFNEN